MSFILVFQVVSVDQVKNLNRRVVPSNGSVLIQWFGSRPSSNGSVQSKGPSNYDFLNLWREVGLSSIASGIIKRVQTTHPTVGQKSEVTLHSLRFFP